MFRYLIERKKSGKNCVSENRRHVNFQFILPIGLYVDIRLYILQEDFLCANSEN